MICELYLNEVIDRNYPKELKMKKLRLRKIEYQNGPTNGIRLGLKLDTHGHYILLSSENWFRIPRGPILK